jgi:hypothetical protein
MARIHGEEAGLWQRNAHLEGVMRGNAGSADFLQEYRLKVR